MEKERQKLRLTVAKNNHCEESCILTQDQLRQIFKDCRLEHNLSIETLGKLTDINPELLRDYEEGNYELRPEFYKLLLYVYGTLNDDFKVRN